MKKITTIIFSLFLASCASPPEFKTVTPSTSTLPINKIYLYSLLDLRADTIGRKMVAEFERQLSGEFEKRGVPTQLLSFSNADMGNSALLEDGGGVEVPIGKLVEKNIDSEKEFNADYRLIIFPSYVRIGGSGIISYQIRWGIFRVYDKQLVWSATSWTSNTNWISADEAFEERAKVLVNGLFNQLENEGILKNTQPKPI